MKFFDQLLDRLVVPALQECADEGVRLGLGAAVRYVSELAEDATTDMEREVLADAADQLRLMSMEYAAL